LFPGQTNQPAKVAIPKRLRRLRIPRLQLTNPPGYRSVVVCGHELGSSARFVAVESTVLYFPTPRTQRNSPKAQMSVSRTQALPGNALSWRLRLAGRQGRQSLPGSAFPDGAWETRV